MPNNLFANTEAVIIAKGNTTFADAGINATNTARIIKIGATRLSYKPGRAVNGITAFETNAGYLILPKVDMDLSAYVYPPITGSSGTVTPPAPTSGVVDDNANTFSYTLAAGYVLADHEQTLNGGTSWGAATNPVAVGNVAKAAGDVQVRVSAATGRNAGPVLSNATPFTVAADSSADLLFNNVAGTNTIADPDAAYALEYIAGDKAYYEENGTAGTGVYGNVAWDTSKKLPAGVSGGIQWQLNEISYGKPYFGLNTAPGPLNNLQQKMSLVINAGSLVYPAEDGVTSGTPTATGVAYSPTLLRIWKEVTTPGTAQFTIRKSEDMGTTWTTLHTYAYTGDVDMYVSADIYKGACYLVQPKIINFTNV